MLTTIFCAVDDFCKLYEKAFACKCLSGGKGIRLRESSMTVSEVITIMIYSKHYGYKNFKTFYLREFETLKKYFPKLVSYTRFIELQKMVLQPLAVFLKTCLMQKCTGSSFIDSTRLCVCNTHRRYSCKLMRSMASSGKTSTGWFFGMKLHLIITPNGEIVDFIVTSGNVADNNHDVIMRLCKNAYGKIFGDKGYIMREDFLRLLNLQGVFFVTKKRKNMKKEATRLSDNQNLKNRGVIESVLNVLKTKFDLEHSRSRSVGGFLNNILVAISAYVFKDQKPSVKIKGGVFENYSENSAFLLSLA
jgi:IS5 family transposase